MHLRSVTRRLQLIPAALSNQRLRRKLWPEAPALQAKHFRNCKLFEDREVLLELMPKNSVCAEVGIFLSNFSEKILRITQPIKLHLVDISGGAIRLLTNDSRRK